MSGYDDWKTTEPDETPWITARDRAARDLDRMAACAHADLIVSPGLVEDGSCATCGASHALVTRHRAQRAAAVARDAMTADEQAAELMDRR